MCRAVALCVLLAAVLGGGCSGVVSPVAPTASRAAPQELFTLSGRIWGETHQNEVLLPGATVLLRNADGERSAVTGDDGAFTIGGLADGRWIVQVGKPGYVSEEAILDLQGDTTINFSLEPLPQGFSPADSDGT